MGGVRSTWRLSRRFHEKPFPPLRDRPPGKGTGQPGSFHTVFTEWAVWVQVRPVRHYPDAHADA